MQHQPIQHGFVLVGAGEETDGPSIEGDPRGAATRSAKGDGLNAENPDDDTYGKAVNAYARALYTVYHRHIPDSYREFARRDEVPFDYSAVSRFLSGNRVAPTDFIDCLVSVCTSLRSLLTEEEQKRLHSRWLAVMRVSSNPYHRLAFQEHQLRTMREQLMEAEELARADRQKLDALRPEFDVLQRRLTEALGSAQRARACEADNVWLRRQLAVAAESVKATERDLQESQARRTELEKTVHFLEREVTVLRRQVALLFREQPTTTEVSLRKERQQNRSVNVSEATSGTQNVTTLEAPKERVTSHRIAFLGGIFACLVSMAAALFLLLPGAIQMLTDDTPGLDFGELDEPSESAEICNSRAACTRPGWVWRVPSAGVVETVFWLDRSDESQELHGNMQVSTYSEDCAGSFEWSIVAEGTEVASGVAVGMESLTDKGTEVSGTAPPKSSEITFTAERTDTLECVATLVWGDASVR